MHSKLDSKGNRSREVIEKLSPGSCSKAIPLSVILKSYIIEWLSSWILFVEVTVIKVVLLKIYDSLSEEISCISSKIEMIIEKENDPFKSKKILLGKSK